MYTCGDHIFYCMLKSILKVFKINLKLNIYPHNTGFYNNLGMYSIIIYFTVCLMI